MTNRAIAASVMAVFGTLGAMVMVWAVPWNRAVPNPVSAAELFSATELAQAETYAGGMRLIAVASLALTLGVWAAAVWWHRRTGWVERLPGTWWIQLTLAVTAVDLGRRMLTLPLAFWARERRLDYGLTTQGVGGFLRDLVLQQALSTVSLLAPVLLVVACARRWQRWWPAVAAVAVATGIAGMSFAYPVLVEPLFARFEPLHDLRLSRAIQSQADRQGVAVDRVLVADASRRTTTLNAYVSGIGATHRVVLYDTAVAELPDDELVSVVSHELAHASHHDVVLGTSLGALGAAAAVGALGVALAGAHRPATPGRGMVVAAALVIGLAATSPLQTVISRQIERRADQVALAAGVDVEPFIRLQRNLALTSLSDPTPPVWWQWWRGTHPTVLERVALAEEGQAGRKRARK